MSTTRTQAVPLPSSAVARRRDALRLADRWTASTSARSSGSSSQSARSIWSAPEIDEPVRVDGALRRPPDLERGRRCRAIAEQPHHAVGELSRHRPVLEDHRWPAGHVVTTSRRRSTARGAERDAGPRSPSRRDRGCGACSSAYRRRARARTRPPAVATRCSPGAPSPAGARSTLTPSERQRSATVVGQMILGRRVERPADAPASPVRRDVALGEEQADDLPHLLVERDVASGRTCRSSSCRAPPRAVGKPQQRRLGQTQRARAARCRADGSPAAAHRPLGLRARCSSVEPDDDVVPRQARWLDGVEHRRAGRRQLRSASGSPSAIGSQSSVVSSPASVTVGVAVTASRRPSDGRLSR